MDMQVINKFKNWLVGKLIGDHYYTEKEVYVILHKMTYEMAQRIIGNRDGEKPVIPTEFFKEHGKYPNTNVYDIVK